LITCDDVLCMALSNQIMPHARRLRAFNRARDRVTLLTPTVLDAAQESSYSTQ